MCLLNDEGYRPIEGSSRPPLINLTVPLRGCDGGESAHLALALTRRLVRLTCLVSSDHCLLENGVRWTLS